MLLLHYYSWQVFDKNLKLYLNNFKIITKFIVRCRGEFQFALINQGCSKGMADTPYESVVIFGFAKYANKMRINSRQELPVMQAVRSVQLG